MTKYIYGDVLIHYGRSIKDGAPGPGTGNWRRGTHWGERTSQIKDDRLSDKERSRYLKRAMLVSDESLIRTIGSSSTKKKQQNRYLRWARTRNERSNNTDKSKRGELAEKEILARKNEAKFYKKALRDSFSKMKNLVDEKIPKDFYNEDLITQAFNDSYNREVIEPAWERFDWAVGFARSIADDDIEFSAFKNNTKLKTRYGYSDVQTGESLNLGLSMDRLAYAEYLLIKKDW